MLDALDIRLADVLYRTRGSDWDYAFVLHPEPLLREGWYRLYRRMFAGVEPGTDPVLLRGSLGVGLGRAFFATAFADAERRDDQGRSIAHYFAWLGPAAERAPDLSFGPALAAALSPALDAIWKLAPGLTRSSDAQPLDRALRAKFAAALPTAVVHVSALKSAPVRWLNTIAG